MEIRDLIPPGLAASARGPSLLALADLYDEVEAATEAFQAAARAHLGPDLPRYGCPQGCGACCERFVPDVLPVEADLAALYILKARPDLQDRPPTATPPCPYYDADKPEAHCQLYPARPLICRLFGYSAVATKVGLASYSLCWSMPTPGGLSRRSWEGPELEAALGVVPPSMASFGLRLQALSPDLPWEKPLLGEAIASSLARLGLTLAYGAEEDRP